MATVTLKGQVTINLNGEILKAGVDAPNFTAVKNDLSVFELAQEKGKRVVLNIFPSIDTGVCAQSVRRFNQDVANLENAIIINVSKDLPFAQARFCGVEGIDKAITVSAFRDDNFEKAYGLKQVDGPLAGLLARAVVVVDENGKVVYSELVPEIAQEPNYEAALASIK